MLPLDPMLESIKGKGLIFSLLTKNMKIHETTLTDYLLDYPCLELFMAGGHEAFIELSQVKKITFDAIISEPTTSEEMRQCLTDLADSVHFNAYLENAEETPIITFLNVWVTPVR